LEKVLVTWLGLFAGAPLIDSGPGYFWAHLVTPLTVLHSLRSTVNLNANI